MIKPIKILCIDDESMMLNAYKRVFRDTSKYHVSTLEDVSQYDLMDALESDVIICDQRMPNILGTDVFKQLGDLGFHGVKIICSAYADFDDIMNAFNHNEIDYFLNKTWSNQEIRSLVDSFNSSNSAENIKSNYNIEDVYILAAKAAKADISIYIQGETGTGKEVLTRYIHQQSKRVNEPYVTVNCATLTSTLFESLMFGHKKGAFTGATSDHIGFYEAADGGTLFLDEVVDIPLESQAKILRALQEGVITRLGETKDIKVDVRVISASAKSITKAVEEGVFREDLMYRLNVYPIHIPPLRSRKGEITGLLTFFLKKFNFHEDWQEITFEAGVEDILVNYPWPGNIRELENTCNYLNVSLDQPYIRKSDLPLHILRAKIVPSKESVSDEMQGGVTLPRVSQVKTHITIEQALEQSGQNKSKAAKLLGVSRMTLWRKIKEMK